MSLADLLIPPSLDAKQALRLRRFGLAALSYALAAALVVLAWAFGVIAAATVLQAAAAVVAINLSLYAAIRSGFNLRFDDPSLTRLQMIVAISVVMFIAYHLRDGRNIVIFGCFIVLLFGVFRLSAREFVVVVLYSLAAYALVIDLLMYLRPQYIRNVFHDWVSWLLFAAFLPWFAVIGGNINTLRRRLHDSEVRFRSLTELSSDFYWESDTEHRLTLLSAGGGARGMPPLRQDPQIGERRWEIPYLSPDAAGWQAHRAVLDAHLPLREFEFSRRAPTAPRAYLSISGNPVFDASGAFMGYRGVGSDITARKQAEQALRDSVKKLRLFADNVPALTVSWDEKLRCRFANKAFTEFFGLDAGQHYRQARARGSGRGGIRGRSRAYFAQVLQGRPVTYQRTLSRENGERRYIEVRLLPQVGDHAEVLGCFAVTTDITEHKLAEERIRSIAHHDSLTGLPNRLLFNDRLDQAISLAKRESRQFALLYLDLDRFKVVNDTLGHAAGDALLQAVAARIRGEVRESDTVARIGGDEFAVILPDIAGREEAQTVARKIIAALAPPFRLASQGPIAEIGTSIGIALYPADGLDADALVKAADAAMYGAKQAGSGFRFF